MAECSPDFPLHADLQLEKLMTIALSVPPLVAFMIDEWV